MPYKKSVKTMREPIPYLQWKERIDAQTPDDCRVGNDFLIVKKPRETDLVDQPFRLDMTLSVFLATGHCTFMADWVEYKAQAPCLFTVSPGQIFQLIALSDDAKPCTIIMSEAFSASLFKEYGSFGRCINPSCANPLSTSPATARPLPAISPCSKHCYNRPSTPSNSKPSGTSPLPCFTATPTSCTTSARYPPPPSRKTCSSNSRPCSGATTGRSAKSPSMPRSSASHPNTCRSLSSSRPAKRPSPASKPTSSPSARPCSSRPT